MRVCAAVAAQSCLASLEVRRGRCVDDGLPLDSAPSGGLNRRWSVRVRRSGSSPDAPLIVQRFALGYLLFNWLLLARQEFSFWLDPHSRVLPDTWVNRHVPLLLGVAHVLVALVLVPLVLGRPIPWARCWPLRRRRKPLLRLVK